MNFIYWLIESWCEWQCDFLWILILVYSEVFCVDNMLGSDVWTLAYPGVFLFATSWDWWEVHCGSRIGSMSTVRMKWGMRLEKYEVRKENWYCAMWQEMWPSEAWFPLHMFFSVFVWFVPVLINAVSWNYKKFLSSVWLALYRVVSSHCILLQNVSWSGLSMINVQRIHGKKEGI